MNIDLSKDQEKALRLFKAFLNNARQEFVLCGAAGTGKSTIIKEMTRGMKVSYAAPTGKAAKVISRKMGGEVEVKTLHSLFMKPIGKPEVEKAKKELYFAQQQGSADIHSKELRLKEMKKRYPGTKFVERDDLPTISLLICDEASMVDHKMMAIAKRACEKILWIGDHAQLPPVRGNNNIINVERADAVLEQIHRQAADSDVIKWATEIREDGDAKECRITNEEFKKRFKDGSQVLVGTHVTRAMVTAKKRKTKGINILSMPREGEPLMVLKNDHELGVMNGEVLTCLSFDELSNGYRVLMSSEDDTNGDVIEMAISHEEFESIEDMTEKGDFKLGFGYTMTVHKSQGSEWDDVLVLDDWAKFSSNYRNWLYTGVTRASKRVGVHSFNKVSVVNELERMKQEAKGEGNDWNW
jgi:exodeoxyribonuclease-5